METKIDDNKNENEKWNTIFAIGIKLLINFRTI